MLVLVGWRTQVCTDRRECNQKLPAGRELEGGGRDHFDFFEKIVVASFELLDY
jgi:hypothetical protein